MKIKSVTTNSFKGYDARPLKGFLVNSNPFGISQELRTIGEKEGFKIYSIINGQVFKDKVNPISYNTFNIWVQDMWTISKNTLLSAVKDRTASKINESLGLVDNKPQLELKSKTDIFSKNKHIAGGNLFIIKGDFGDEILVGSDELKKFDPSEIMAMYSVNKVTIIPQMDFHLDLFIRPLDKKRVLLADDTKTLDVLKKGQKKFQDFLSILTEEKKQDYKTQTLAFHNLIGNFEEYVKRNHYAPSCLVEKTLKEADFEVIKVPGRVYESYTVRDNPNLVSSCNFMNANIAFNKDGKLVYITNKSPIDEMLFLTPELSEKIDFSFEQEFIESLAPYIEKEHIYFIEGMDGFIKDQMLKFYGGGIHCATMEIPKEMK